MTAYAPSAASPRWLQRAVDQTISLPVYRDGALAEPSSGTLSLYNPSGELQISGRAVSIAALTASVALLATDLPATVAYGEGWREEWALTMPDGAQHTFVRPAAVVRTRLYPVISDLDLITRYPDLSRLRPSTLSSWQSFIDEAWTLIVGRLYNAGNWPYLVMDPYTLREPHLDLTLTLVFQAMHTGTGGPGGDSRWDDLARSHRLNFEHHWKRLRFRYDSDIDGHVDSSDQRTANAVIFTNVPNETWWS